MRNPRKRNQNMGKVSIIKVLCMTVILLLLIIAAALFLGNLNLTDNSDVADSELFLSINSDTVKDVLPFSDGVAVLTSSSVKYLDASGNEIVTNLHSFSNPRAEINSKTLLLYDSGGYNLRIENNSSEYSSFTFDSVITSAAVGKKGNYAYSLNSDAGYQSHLYVYSLRGAKLFEWGSAGDYIVDIALSDNGKYVAVAVLGIDSAEYYSKIILFKFNSSEPVYTVNLYDTTVYQIDFVSSKKLSVFSDSGVYLTDSKGECTCVQAYSSTEIAHSSLFYNGLSCTLISLYGNEKSPKLTVFNKNCVEKYECSYTEEINDVYCSKNYVALVFDSKIQVLNGENTVVGNIVLDEACIDVVIADRRVYALTSSGIYSFSVNYNNSAVINFDNLSEDSLTQNTTVEEENTTQKEEQSHTQLSGAVG